MKKLIAISSVLAILAGSSAYAKTEGNYIGVSLLDLKSSQQYNGRVNDTTIGYGVDYKYAFNFGNNIFLAPGVFYERIGTSAINSANADLKIRSRYGAKLDLGYDISKQFAVYFTNGIASSRTTVSTNTEMSNMKYFYGLGGLFHATKNVTLNIEYNTQDFNAKGPDQSIDAKTKLEVLKFGVAYHF